MVLDNIVQVEEFFTSENYQAAYDNYLLALKHSNASAKNTRNYIQRRLNIIEIYLNIGQFMALADYLFQNGEYDEAENLYLKASKTVSTMHDNSIREKVTEALEKIYDKCAEIQKASEQQLNTKRHAAINDAIKKGDELLAAGDLEGARKAYLDARTLSTDLAGVMQTTAALDKVSAAKNKKSEDITQAAVDDAMKKGDDLLAAGDLEGAQKVNPSRNNGHKKAKKKQVNT